MKCALKDNLIHCIKRDKSTSGSGQTQNRTAVLQNFLTNPFSLVNASVKVWVVKILISRMGRELANEQMIIFRRDDDGCFSSQSVFL